MRYVLLAVWWAILAVSAHAQIQDPNTRNPQIVTKNIGIDQKLDAQIPLDLVFRDEYGKTVTLDQYFHKQPVILVPVFYSCKGTCTLVFDAVMRTVIGMKKDDIGKTYDVLTVSIHPKETEVDAMSKKTTVMEVYNRPGADKGWHFLTGSQESIRALTASVGFRFTYNEKRGQINHPAGIMILTPEGKVSQYFYGVEYASKYVLGSIRKAADGKIGQVADVRLFGCFEYDPVTGGYKLVVMRTLQVAGTGTVLILAISIAVMSLRNRYRAVAAAAESGGKSR